MKESNLTFMGNKVILSVDLGTSAVKAVLFDTEMNMVCLTRRTYPLLTPQSGWNEQDPETVLTGTAEAIAEILQLCEGKDLIGVVLSCQMASILAVDCQGRPETRIMTWSDTRSKRISELIKKDPRANQVYRKTCCPLEAIYPLSKIRWMVENHLTQSDTRFIGVKDYLVFHLTGRFITDWSMASSTGLMDIHEHEWNSDALSLAGIRSDNLPEIVSTRTTITLQDSEYLRKTGIPVGTPLIMGAGDAPLSSLGVGALDPGALVVNVGTSTAARKMVNRARPDEKQQLWTYVLDETHLVTGGMSSSGGMIYDWYKNQFVVSADINAFYELEKQALIVPPGSEGLMFIPYLAGEQCPSWRAETRGSFHGLDILHTRGHMTRAVLEGITFSIYRIIETIQSVHATPIREIRVTGGLATSELWKHIAADVLGQPLVISDSNEGSARGGAFLGLNALGYLGSLDEVIKYSFDGEDVLPNADNHYRYMEEYQHFLMVLERMNSCG